MRGALTRRGLRGVVFEHGEKPIFAAAVLCFLLLVESLFRHEVLPPDKQPQRLLDAVNEARSAMEWQQWNPLREGIVVVDYRTRAQRRGVVAADYELRQPFEFAAPRKIKRADPELFPVASLRVSSAMGAFALTVDKPAPAPPPVPAENRGRNPGKKPNPPVQEQRNDGRRRDPARPLPPAPQDMPAKAKLQRMQWTVVTALVPYRQQCAEFDRAFKAAVPVVGVVGAPADSNAAQFRNTPVYVRLQVERAEFVNGTAPHWETLTCRGYFKNRPRWTHVCPDVVSKRYLDAVYTMPLGPLAASDWDESVGHAPEIPFIAIESEQAGNAANAAAEAPPEPADGLDFRPLERQAPQAARQLPGKAEPMPVEYRLVRVFDFDVEQGKAYQYRIRLIINNPNFGLPARMLQNVASGLEEFRETPWSEPSPPVQVRPAEQIWVAATQPARGIRDTTIRVKLMTLDPDMGVPTVMKENVGRGTMLNFRRNVDVADLIHHDWVKRDVEFRTGALLLDVRGGRSLSTRDKTVTEPGEALLFSRDGQLKAHNELDDLSPWQEYPAPEEIQHNPAAEKQRLEL